MKPRHGKTRGAGKKAAYKIRTSTDADFKLILAHRRAMFESVGYADKKRLDGMLRAYARWLRKALNSGRYIGWFAETADGQVVAGAGLWIMEWPPTPGDPSASRGYIANVYTHGAHRRRGLARKLMKEMLAWCRRRMRTVTLHASDQGLPLYESLGFERTREMRLLLRKR